MLFECSEDEFVSPLSVCNGVVECSNNEDELHCKEKRNCTKNYFQCTDGECIHSSRVCDFRQDCADNSDEYCDYQACSLATEFECKNYQCIPKYQACDAVPHCVDGSDEKDCANCNISVSFPCIDKRCIPRELLFDNHPDCLNGEDEDYGRSFYELHSCDDVLLAGIWESGIYYIATRWTECIFDFDNQTITMTISNIDWSPGFEDRSIYLIPSMLDYNGYICYQTFHLDLPISRTMLSQDNSLSEWKEKSIKLIGNSTEAILRGTLINRDEFTGNVQVSFGTNYNRQKLAFGIGPITCVKNLTDGIRTNLIVPEYISAHVTKGTEWRNLTSCGLLAKPIFTKRSCVFDVDGQKPVEGCRSLEHLQNCEFINCEPHYFKCPGSFCIPYHFVCDGRIHCPDSFDERNCSSGARIKGILIYYIGKDAEIEDAAHNLASQMFSEDTHIQIFFTVKHNIKMTENGQSSVYLVRTYNVLSMTALSKKYKKEYNISMDNFESDVEKLIRFNGTNETFSVFLQNGELRKKEEDLFHKFDETLATQYRFRIEKDGSFYKNLQVSMSKDGKTKYLKLNNWKLLRSGGTLLFPEIFSANHGCHNAFRCSFSHVCLPFEQVCDGRKHCPHGDDEDLCHFVCPNNCTCEGYSSSCPSLQYNVFNSISSLVRILDINHCKGLNGTLDIKTDLYFLIELNVSFSNIRLIHNESFAHTRNILILDLSYNLLSFIQKEIFKDLRFIRILLLEGNELISTIEPNAFYGLGLKHLSVTHTMLQVVSRRIFNGFNATKLDLSYNTIETIEDNAFEGLHVEELDITFNPIKNFGKAMFTGVTGLQKLKTPMYKFCCMRPIYLEENKCFPHQDEFSSCGDLMRRTSLQFLLWIIAVLAIVGNILSVVFRMVFDKKRIKMVYGIFVTNLAFSDMLMGFYMLIIAIADRLYHDRYIEEDERWRSSGWCSLAGIMSTVSSEASVLFVCLITIDRLLVIKYPFGSFKISTRQAKIVVSICWSICLIVAVIPIIESKYFGNQFYSKSGVCLALPLSKERSPGWLYSVLIFIGFNFVTFILIALGQILIFCEVRRAASTMKKKSSARRNDLKVARNLLLLVGTDFACWFPIGCMGIMTLHGYSIPGEVYAWTAVLVLPINSAINPFLYTLMAIISKKSFNPSEDEQSRPEDIEEKRSAFLRACQGLWFPDPDIKYEVHQLTSDIITQLKPAERLMIFAKMFKSLHLHHRHGLLFKNLDTEKVLVYLRGGQIISGGGLRIIHKPTPFSRKTESKQDMYIAGILLRPLTK
ncbi:uncharacterized protein LOC132742176 [Ruditapes philippinarum]|uniref:uncharacterized protein LOC132742176 n=1 Tax=Ruditapes philippinarum TaxID=129788 RepID=UPI00295A93CD|nr:uncharacterized protein LOC132742176 [Ruditapes philippinarum]